MNPSCNVLSPSHYAYRWDTKALRSIPEITALGQTYALLPEGAEKQAALLELCQCFHGYLTKYLIMIVRGHVPVRGARGQSKFIINKDVEPFIRYFLPKGSKLTRRTVTQVVRHFHLAFKEMEADEIYDTLMEQLIQAVHKYDPKYTEKVQRVVGVIDEQLSKQEQFSVAEVRRHVEFDCDKHVRMLCRRGFLTPVQGTSGKQQYQRLQWPPPAKLFEQGAIGLAYYLQTWFRYYLQAWIDERMGELESKEGVYSLEFFSSEDGAHTGDPDGHRDIRIPSAEGAFTDREGNRWAADVSMMTKPLDVSKMTIEWVEETFDPVNRPYFPLIRLCPTGTATSAKTADPNRSGLAS